MNSHSANKEAFNLNMIMWVPLLITKAVYVHFSRLPSSSLNPDILLVEGIFYQGDVFFLQTKVELLICLDRG